MVKGLSILGSTGSIGTQALEVCRALHIPVISLAAGANIKLLEEQIREFKPMLAAVYDEEAAGQLKVAVADTPTRVVSGMEGVIESVTCEKADTVLTSVVGIAGLMPTMAAIQSGKHIALSNKETLVTAGGIVMAEARKMGVNIIPVDSEHSAIFQCLAGNQRADVERIILTASGGPFRGYTSERLKEVTLEEALRHPNWSMGKKITVDSATMMNKGLEVIEAMWLFDVDLSQIEVVVHKESVIHSLVAYRDGSLIAQLGAPDMRIPIQLALTWPQRCDNSFNRVSLAEIGSLTFEKPDPKVFRCLELAFEAARIGGTMPAAMNGANEVAVDLFLKKAITFNQIPLLIEKAMSKHQVNSEPVLNDIISTDRASRQIALEAYHGGL